MISFEALGFVNFSLLLGEGGATRRSLMLRHPLKLAGLAPMQLQHLAGFDLSLTGQSLEMWLPAHLMQRGDRLQFIEEWL